MMDLQNRRRVGVLIRILLIIGTFVFIGVWLARRIPDGPDHVSVQSEAPPATALGPGDIQIISTNGNVDLILQGDKIMGGLSPAMVKKIRDDMTKSAAKETTGFGGMIAGIVTQGVASAIGTHVTYPVSEITELSFKDGKLTLKTRSGGDKEQSFGDVNVDADSKDGKTTKEPTRFSEEDAKRFVAAFEARRRELAGLK
jgi:hypothetical protein